MTVAAQPTDTARFNMAYVWTISLVAAMGGLMFGYDWIVIGGTKPFYERFFDISTAWDEGWAMSSALVGCLIGAVLSGGLSDRLGRKRLLIFSALVFLVSSLGTALVSSFLAFNLWRIAGGVAIGLASNLSPMYIAEISPAAMRGRLVAMNQFTIVIGILLAQVLNYAIEEHGTLVDEAALSVSAEGPLDANRIAAELAWQADRKDRLAIREEFSRMAAEQPRGLYSGTVSDLVDKMNQQRVGTPLSVDSVSVDLAGRGLTSWNVSHGWRWMFGITAVPALAFFLLMFVVPESPRWLVKSGKSPEAREVLTRIGGPAYAEGEVSSIEATLVGEIEKVDFRELLEPRMAWILTLGVGLAVLQQWCGINVIFYYAADLFKAAGYTLSGAMLNIVIIGAVNLLFTIAAIGSVDRFGRRGLMLIGFLGLALLHTLIGHCFSVGTSGLLVLVLTVAAIGCYGLSLAPVTWVVLSEIFPNRIRGAAMSISVFSLWTACFVLTITFPLLSESLGKAGTFWIYAGICAFGFLFTFFSLPETKGKTLEEIEREMAG
jgi:MFS family permease